MTIGPASVPRDCGILPGCQQRHCEQGTGEPPRPVGASSAEASPISATWVRPSDAKAEAARIRIACIDEEREAERHRAVDRRQLHWPRAGRILSARTRGSARSK